MYVASLLFQGESNVELQVILNCMGHSFCSFSILLVISRFSPWLEAYSLINCKR